MKSLLWLLCVISSLQCVAAQISLVVSGPGTVKPTETLEKTCKVSGASLNDRTNMYGVSWVRQSDGKGLEWLGRMRYDADTYYAQSLQGRITITRDTNKGEVYLKLTGAKPDESGTYYCDRETGLYSGSPYSGGYNYNALDIWSQGAWLTVTAAEERAPSLFPLYPCGLSSESPVTIGCMARDFLPGAINFTWTDKSSNYFDNGLKTYRPILQSSGTYIASSQIQVTAASWKKPDPYYCMAKHSKNSKTVTLQYKSNKENSKPIVTMHAPVKDDVIENGNATIVCVAGHYYPSDIKIKWMKNHVATTLNTMTETANTDADGKYVISSYITVSKQEWNENTVLSCVVEHSATDFFEIKNLSKSQACEVSTSPGVIQVTAVPPSFETIYFKKNAPLTCIVSNMLTPDGLDVSWYKSGSEIKLDTKLENPVFQDNSFSVKAIATVCPEDWDKESYECIVKHPDLTSPKKVTLVKENVQESQTPTVLLYPPHPDELSKKETLTLTCLARGFAPRDAFFKWADSEPIDNRYVVTTPPMEEAYSNGQKTYFMYSTLTLPSVEDWNSGKSFTCVFGHESLPLQITQKTVDKTTGNPKNVNVSLVLSDTC